MAGNGLVAKVARLGVVACSPVSLLFVILHSVDDWAIPPREMVTAALLTAFAIPLAILHNRWIALALLFALLLYQSILEAQNHGFSMRAPLQVEHYSTIVLLLAVVWLISEIEPSRMAIELTILWTIAGVAATSGVPTVILGDYISDGYTSEALISLTPFGVAAAIQGAKRIEGGATQQQATVAMSAFALPLFLTFFVFGPGTIIGLAFWDLSLVVSLGAVVRTIISNRRHLSRRTLADPEPLAGSSANESIGV